MSFRPQTGARRNAARQFSKSAHDKKAKEKKQRGAGKYFEEQPEVSQKEVVEKTLNSLNRLGNQVFALSPFSQYYDDWLVTLRQIVSEFESSSAIIADEQFTKERAQIFLDVEATLAEIRLKESTISAEAKELADNNHLLVETDKEYAEKTRELNNRRNLEIQRLTNKIGDLENDINTQEQIKISFFKPMARSKAKEKLSQTRHYLKSAKNELEVMLQTYTVEQEKLHDNYEKKKEEITYIVEQLQKELEKLEIDTSVGARQTACAALGNSINVLQSRVQSG
jgi:hypothetical protein